MTIASTYTINKWGVPETSDVKNAEERIQRVMNDNDISMELTEFIHVCLDCIDTSHITIYDSDARGNIPSYLWEDIATIIGSPITGVVPEYFSCSC